MVNIWSLLLGLPSFLSDDFTPIEIALTVIVGIACIIGLIRGFSETLQASSVETNTRVLSHRTLGSDRLPPLAGWESNPDKATDHGAQWWAIEKAEIPQIADVGMTGLCRVKNRGDEANQCANSKADCEMASSRGSAQNFKATDFASGVSESITVCASVYNERVCGKVAQMSDNKAAVSSHHESNRSAACNC